MSDVAATTPTVPEAIHPPAISLREILPWALFALALLALYYMVGMDEGALTLVPGQNVHEWMHDGRHLLGFPCH
jgi:hypothetical protein